MQTLLNRLKIELSGINYNFSVVIIDIDFFIRYCMKFSEDQCNRIMNNIKTFFFNEFACHKVFFHVNSDEFIFILNDKTNNQTKEMVGEILKKFRKQRFAIHLGDAYKTLRITFSAGIASYPENGEKDIICKKALTALFLAKSFRRNNIVCYEEERKHNNSRIIYDNSISIKKIIGRWGEAGNIKRSVSGSMCLMWEPQAIAADNKGNLYIADQNNHQILCYDGKYVRRVAGNGSFGYRGDNKKALRAQLNKPTGLCVYREKLYITDTGNDTVRMVDLKTKIISTICGTGQTGYSGDGGLARNAQLNKPGGIIIGKNQNIYINDIANNVIRKIDKNGYISTFAGNGHFGYNGDGKKATQVSFNEIYGMGIDKNSENLFIADYFNHRIRKINLKTNIVTTVAGNGISGYTGDGDNPIFAALNRPTAVCLDDADNLYITESGNSSIRVVISKENKIYTLVGGCGIGTGQNEDISTFKLANPNGLTVYKNKLYILDGANNRVCKIKLKFLEG